MAAHNAIRQWLEGLSDLIFGLFGLKLTTKHAYLTMFDRSQKFFESRERALKLELATTLFIGEGFASKLTMSQSQLGQDFLALASAGKKRDGFFVEFGAADGVKLSNTFLLEESFGWKGILAEPNRRYFSKLSESRSVILDNRAVGPETGLQLEFLDAGLNSSIHSFRNKERWPRNPPTYKVETVSLLDLLRGHDAPAKIDFLSIDTEGNELATLQAFDFSEYEIGCICVESNGQEEGLIRLLSSNGFELVLRDSSRWDLWFVRAEKLGTFAHQS